MRGLGATTLAGCVDVDGDGDRDLVGGRTVIFNPGDIREVLTTGGSSISRYEPLDDIDRDGDPDSGLFLGQVFSWSEALGDGTFGAGWSSWPAPGAPSRDRERVAGGSPSSRRPPGSPSAPPVGRSRAGPLVRAPRGQRPD